MKTLKLTLIVALVACTMASFANYDGIREKPKFKKVVNVAIENAAETPGLVTAMYSQLDINDYMLDHQLYWTAQINFRENVYRICGSREQWLRFFMKVGEKPAKTKYRPDSTN